MNHVSLFTGIGGLDLAAEWAGFESVLQVEMDEYANKILQKHWPNVPRIKDVREVTYERVQQIMANPTGSNAGSRERQHKSKKSTNRESTFVLSNSGGTSGGNQTGDNNKGQSRKNREVEPITVISGGFPCQPFSQAGKRGGTGDDRYLWPEMLRVIREIKPTWIVGENVSGLLSLNEGLEFETIAADLEEAGYEVLPLHYPAAGVGAVHRRDRIFIVAYRKDKGIIRRERFKVDDTGQGKQRRDRSRGSEFNGRGKDVADTEQQRLERQPNAKPKQRNRASLYSRCSISGEQQWATEPDVGRVANGISNRVDRLRALGNAVVPQQAYPIFKAIAKVERKANEKRR